jgi:hypothetical protein
VDLQTLIRIIFRRWYVVIPVLALTGLVGQYMLSSTEPEYDASGSVLLLSPFQQGDPEDPADPADVDDPGNAYLAFNASLRTTATAMERIMSDSSSRRAIRELGHEGTYVVEVDQEGPILNITATAQRPDEAIQTVVGVFELIAAELDERQDAVNANPDQRIRTQVLFTPSRASEQTTARTRTLVALGALGLAAAASAAVLTESLVVGRRRRTRGRTGAAAVFGPPPAPGVAADAYAPVGAEPRLAAVDARGGRRSRSGELTGVLGSWAEWNAGRRRHDDEHEEHADGGHAPVQTATANRPEDDASAR